ncbi:85/88 kDa calcium-independent phospholipase A2 [Adelges cooleyi]|uniref:85/88 kDa calcium-independent phospholipase A2 n=1 Tax=Adelges cooleyi TaxID=133065 RepID=UPI00217F2A66|nr:85/88 kDa calcium-independent phospholipase A2 [Adelges cooleyi]
MSWLNTLKDFFTPENNPNKVVEVKSDKYSSRNIHCRHHGMILYALDSNNVTEIVLHLESLTTSFSLYRGRTIEDAEVRFCIFKDKLPDLLNISKDGYNLSLIQGLCDTLIQHPTWTIAHLAVHLSMNDIFSHPQIAPFLNTPDPESGMSPLQLAIYNNSISVVKALIQLDVSLDYLDNEANSVFHYAAKSSCDIIQVLSKVNTNCLNYRNINGFTPLHLACQADKPECVKGLLVCGADVNIPAGAPMSENKLPGIVKEYLQDNHKKLFVEDMKFGGTPLHWSSSREVIDSLISNNCDLNALNFDKRTALHIMVLRNRFDCVMGLLCHGANLNIADGEGNTPLHLAVKNNLIPIIHALIVFEADVNYINNLGLTARHIAATNNGPDKVSDKIVYILHAVGANRCTVRNINSTDTSCAKGCVWNQQYNGLPPQKPISMPVRSIVSVMEEVMEERTNLNCNVKGGRVLCLDGGGIRGLVLISILLHIENTTNVPIIHCFDWLAGTSTGGILALGLACGKSLTECLCLYFRLKQQVFQGSKPYSSEILENMLQETLGSKTLMSDIKHPKLLVTGLLADRKPVDLHIFRNYKSPSDMLNLDIPCDYPPPPPPTEQLAWKAARASGAAPSYFRMFGRFLDGGLISNNPTLDTLTEIEEYNLALYKTNRANEMCDPSVVVSVGTGSIPVTEVKNLDIFKPSSVSDSLRLVFGFSALGLLLIDQATQSDGRVVDRARAWCYKTKTAFFRFCPQLSEDIAMDEKDDMKLVKVLWETKADMVKNHCKVINLAQLLK